MLRQSNRERLPFKKWYVMGFLSLLFSIIFFSGGIFFYASEGTKATQQRIYESSLWNALQFQLQSYRFVNYLIQIKPSDLPLKGEAYNQYELLMSRLDLLRNGDVGYLIRGITGGRTLRLLNIITGELELISLNLTKVENGDLSYLDSMVNRMHHLDKQVNELTVLVSRDTNKYIATQRRHLGDNLRHIQWMIGGFLLSLSLLLVCLVKSYQQYKKVFKQNQQLTQRVLYIKEEQAQKLGMIEQEMRPSIQALSSLSENFIKTDLQANKEQMSNHIKESSQQLMTTLNMFTDIALLEVNKLDLKYTTDNLEQFMESRILSMALQIHRKGLRLATYVDPFIQSTISLDFKRFSDILSVFVQNAITYTPQGGSISIHILPSDNETPSPQTGERMMRIVVQDNGIGMPNSVQTALRSKKPFSPSKEESPFHEEVGLGLAFCYKLVEHMQGDIHFTSEADHGSEFWIDIPYHITSDSQPLPTPLRSHTITRALLFETDPILTNTLVLQLSKMNIEAILYDPQHYPSEEDFDVIVTHVDTLSQEMENDIQQWSENGKPVLYGTLMSAEEEYIGSNGGGLSSPLTQSKLERVLLQYT
ncbi:Signal transduction histidine-protein kinase BarA [Marinomonas spartinae]|uniref:histidine kinase n=1 Tax=Marinomonas spartinae TaxID=1792290 RepID=A0A1A8T217_9GAMM|nr:HAMP domain-containing sensor histidine kinase [Marinomonas spartinae]SBS24954.1 Signal transduction histidine-protein kinase BarA [Marinomonas spartinae]SBS25226.1 Signal transduction histidine-protein kinase BarA [Marinomonas spartinae]